MIDNNYSMSDTWFDKVPKVELHIHLEGAIPHDALWELVQKYGGESSLPNLQSLKEKFQHRDFPHFIETWVWKNQFLREYEDFTFFAKAVAKDFVHYDVYMSQAEIVNTSGIAPVQQITDIATNTYQATGLEDGAKCYFAVTAVDESGILCGGMPSPFSKLKTISVI